MEDAVVALPLPRVEQRPDVRLDLAVRRHDALGASRRAAGVEDHRGSIRPDRWKRTRIGRIERGGARVRVGCVVERDAALPRGALDATSRFSGSDERGAVRVIDHVFDLASGMVRTEGDGDPAGAPDGPLRDDVLESRLHEEPHPGPVQVGEPRPGEESARPES